MAYPKWILSKNTGVAESLVDRIFEKAFAQTGGPEGEIRKYSWKLMRHTFKADDPDTCSWYPTAYIRMTGDAIVITAELPGVNRDDVYVGVKNNVLTLKGERSVEAVMRDESRAHRQHCSWTFRRAFILPETVEPDHIKAKFTSGILNVEILRTKK